MGKFFNPMFFVTDQMAFNVIHLKTERKFSKDQNSKNISISHLMYTVHKVGNSKKGPLELKYFVYIALMISKIWVSNIIACEAITRCEPWGTLICKHTPQSGHFI